MPSYDAFIHLRRSLFLARTDSMAMLTVYCHDSGTHRSSRVCVVAGYVSNVAQWEIFTKEWMKVLKDFGISKMRRADLENFKGEFKNWNPTRRTALMQRLQPIMMRRTKMPVASIMLKDDFEQIMPSGLQRQAGGMYGFLAYTCLVGVGQWCSKRSRLHCDPIDWVFEAGTEGSHQVDQMFKATSANEATRQKSRLGRWSFKGKDTVPLQSADVLAYECFKLVENQVLAKGQKHPVRISMRKLMGVEPNPYMRFLDRPVLEFFRAEWDKHGIEL